MATLTAVADTATWATEAEIVAAVVLDREQHGVRPQRNLAQHVVDTYGVLRKRQAIGGDGTISIRQIARDLYPDVGNDYDAYRRKAESIRRWLAVLERQGLISKEELRGTEGAGKSLGLRTALLPVPERIGRMAGMRGCSSVG
jgi:hypothetical protein